MDLDLSDLANLEQQFYDMGFKDGSQHGRIHGSIEGRALGKEKGFEMWEEVGFYFGLASIWKCFIDTQAEQNPRAILHLTHLLEAITSFPMSNSPDTTRGEVDISQLLSRIRARYKATCASLGIRPRLLLSGIETIADTGGPESPPGNTGGVSDKPVVWSFTELASKPGGLAF